MKSIIIKKLYREMKDYIDKNITVTGWVRTIRDSRTFGFIEISDGSFFKTLQVVFEEEKISNFKEITKVSLGSSIIVEGVLVETPNAKQPFEIKASRIEIEGLSNSEYPLQKKKHSFEFLRTIAHLRPRTNTFSAVFRVRSLAAYAIHKFFQERGFVYVNTPIITGSDAEGAGKMFRVTTLDMNEPPRDKAGKIDFSQEFFGKETNLTVSGKLEGETYCMAFRNIYT